MTKSGILILIWYLLVAGAGTTVESTVIFDSSISYTVNGNPRSICAGDFNNDSRPDLAVASINAASIFVLFNVGNETFGAPVGYPVGNSPSGICTADFDRDGWLDVAVTNAWSNTTSVLINQGDGTFGPAANYNHPNYDYPVPICAADFNGDGFPDLATGNDGVYKTITIFMNNGQGEFLSGLDYNVLHRSYSVCAADFDGDGDLDIAAPNPEGNQLSIIANDGSGRFGLLSDREVGFYPWYVCTSDFDLNGLPDLATANEGSDNISMIANIGAGQFSPATNYMVGDGPKAICAGELDGRTGDDIVVANHNTNELSILLNDGTGTLVTFGNLRVGANPYSVCMADFNSDGMTDIAATNYYAESISIIFNRTFSQAIVDFGITGATGMGNIMHHQPEFWWSVIPSLAADIDSFIIAVGTDNDWQFAEKWNPAPFASTDTFVTYDGSALLDGQTYYLRLRVRNTLAWSDWYQTSFRMNSMPTSPVLRAPTNLAVVGSTPILWITNGTDAESDPLTYEFAGFHDTDCVSGPDINLIGVASGVDSTGGQIVDPLAENCRYWWMARAFDGYEYSPWTSYAQFLVNGTPEAPAAPMLDYPPLPDNKPIFTLLPTLDWQDSHDPDPGDTVRYKLELSDRANFSFALVRDSLLNTDLPLIDSLVFGTHYYWRVTAKDKSGLSAMSGVKEFWTWKLGDMNHSHTVDLSDLSLLIAYLTQTPRPDISPKMVADLTGNCKIDLSDLSVMVAFMTTSGVQLQVGCE